MVSQTRTTDLASHTILATKIREKLVCNLIFNALETANMFDRLPSHASLLSHLQGYQASGEAKGGEGRSAR